MSMSRWRHRIQICKVNRLAHDTAVINLLRELNCHLQVEECLDQCTRCDRLALALIDGRMHTAPSPLGILDMIICINSDTESRSDTGRNQASEPGNR